MNGNGRGRFGLYDNSAIRVGATILEGSDGSPCLMQSGEGRAAFQTPGPAVASLQC
jgi:hypothetical protein